MPTYLESLDGSQSYLAEIFCDASKLEEGKTYDTKEIGFVDWLKTTAHSKSPQKKLKANWYGPRATEPKGEK